MLLGACGMLLALGVIAPAVVFGGGTVSLGSVFVMLGSFVVFFFGHVVLVGWQLPVGTNPAYASSFQPLTKAATTCPQPSRPAAEITHRELAARGAQGE
jgi:hypothetical protein